MNSDTAIAVLGLLLLLAVIGLAFMAVVLEEARSHQEYLRGQVTKYRRKARERELALVDPAGAPTGMGWKLDPPPERTRLRPEGRRGNSTLPLATTSSRRPC